ncbi:MAG: CCC motif membrane protein [Fluviicola sp.]
MSENNLDAEVRESNTNYGGAQENLPNAVAILVLGIISIVSCWLYGIIGLICGVIALSLFSKDKQLYRANPEKYQNSYKLANAGFICAIVGASLSALYLIFAIVVLMGAASMGSRF